MIMRRLLFALLAATVLSAAPARAGNDDSCDIGVAPAATLLLPYFEVDLTEPAGGARTTVFTVTNVSPQPQIAHVTLWTDWGYAALGFNVFLPPYGVQSVDLRELFVRGAIAPGALHPDRDILFDAARRNTNLRTKADAADSVLASCAEMPVALTPAMLADLGRIFTTGTHRAFLGPECLGKLGGTHANAIGYATVDVVATCTTGFPGPAYFAGDILFDNVLIGDYVTVDPGFATGAWAAANPMVHIRAIPEGGQAGSTPGTNLPFTFYDRYTTTTPQTLPRSIDRRQPLPSAFAARWIQGGTSGFNTDYQIWRERLTTGPSTSCAVAVNSAIGIVDMVRFDEHENSDAAPPPPVIGELPPPPISVLPAVSSTPASSSLFPGLTPSGDLGGWMYLDLDSQNIPRFSGPAPRASQNWVTIRMLAPGRAVQFDAAQLGNGCSSAIPHGTTIGPAGGTPVCPMGATGCTPGVAPYPGTNANPPP